MLKRSFVDLITSPGRLKAVLVAIPAIVNALDPMSLAVSNPTSAVATPNSVASLTVGRVFLT